MLQKALLYLHTLRYLKIEQIYFQIQYWFKWRYFYNINNYSALDGLTWITKGLDFPYLYSGNQTVRALSFGLINLQKEFDSKVDWNFSEHGKLWNYHLQYLNYLFDDSIPMDHRLNLLKDISVNILSEELKLEPYPVSLRIFHSFIFLDKYALPLDSEIDLALKRQVCFLERNLEFHLGANHLLENYMALCLAHCFLNQPQIFIKYYKKLHVQLKEQILDDGGHYEKCPTYHLNILYRLMLLAYTIHQSFGNKFDLNFIKQKIAKMLSWSDQMLLDHAHFPLFNDSVYGQSPQVKQIQEFAHKLNIPSETYPLGASGFRILKNADFTVIINCGPIQPEFQPGHLHSDLLHFVLYYKGQAICIDRGISSYDNQSVRLEEKSTSSHNTVSFAHENQSQIWASFRMAKRAKIQLLSFENKSLEALVIWHNEFEHRRKFLLEENALYIEDCIVPLKGHSNTTIASFHFDSSLQIDSFENEFLISELKMKFNGSNRIELIPFEQAVDFNSKLNSNKIVVQFEKTLVTSLKRTL